MKNIFIISAFCKTALIVALIVPCSSRAQEIPAELKIKKARYHLSVSVSRLKIIKTDLLEIKKKYTALNRLDDSRFIPIILIIDNISMVETICVYEGILLDTFDILEEKRKLKQYDLHYSRMKNSTLKRLYLTYRNIQAYINSTNDKEISSLAIAVKDEIIEVQKRIEDIISILYDLRKSAS